MTTVANLKDFVRSNGFAWPGGYPCALLMLDGEAIDAKSTRENYRQIRQNMKQCSDKAWTPVEVFINWEDADLRCAHSNRVIQSAYN